MKKRITAVLLSIAMLITFAACGSSSAREESYYDGGYSYEVSYSGGSASLPGDTNAKTENVPDVTEGRKIIYTAGYTVETTDFDGSWEAIRERCDRYGAYISSSWLSGGSGSTKETSSPRYLELTVRIPAENYRAFLEERTEFGTVTSFRESTDDVTATYVDTEARLTSLRTQEERLLSLISEAASLEELLLLEDKLSEVRYEIESAEGLLRTYDDLISYCTVNITVTEVSVITIVNTGFGYKLKEAFVSSWADFVNVMQEIIIGLVSVFPMLIILGTAAFFIIRKVKKDRRDRTFAVSKGVPSAEEAPGEDL